MVTTRRVALTVAAMFAVLVLVVAAAAAEGSDRNDGTANCETCELIANGIAIEMNKLEEPSLQGLSEADVAQRSSRRRKLLHGRSEVKIAEVLESFCPQLMRAGGGMLPGVGPLCTTLVERHGDALGDHVFADGPRAMRDFLCVRLARMCPRLVTKEEL